MCSDKKKVFAPRLHEPSGLSCRPSQLSVLQLLLMLEVRLPQAFRGMVPITSGNETDKFRPPGTSTYTCGGGQEVEKQPSCLCTHRLMECRIKKNRAAAVTLQTCD